MNVLESMNTAIEYICDYSCREYNSVIGLVKDIASGAVLLAAVFSVVTGIIIFGDIDRIIGVLRHVFTTWYLAVIFVLSLPASAYFVMGIKNIRQHGDSAVPAERNKNDK